MVLFISVGLNPNIHDNPRKDESRKNFILVTKCLYFQKEELRGFWNLDFLASEPQDENDQQSEKIKLLYRDMGNYQLVVGNELKFGIQCWINKLNFRVAFRHLVQRVIS